MIKMKDIFLKNKLRAINEDALDDISDDNPFPYGDDKNAIKIFDEFDDLYMKLLNYVNIKYSDRKKHPPQFDRLSKSISNLQHSIVEARKQVNLTYKYIAKK